MNEQQKVELGTMTPKEVAEILGKGKFQTCPYLLKAMSKNS